jgi:hypothetical protein
MNTYRPAFVAGLKLLAEAFRDVVAAGYSRPVLVGGAAVEFYTGGAITSGDFDVVTAAQEELERSLLARGFVRPTAAGMLRRGLHHPELGIGVEVVSGALFDGAADASRVTAISLETGDIFVPAIEDMIADRAGQFSASGLRDKAMLSQAVALYQIAKAGLGTVDDDYLDRRVREETAGDLDLQWLTEKADEADHSR